MGGVEGCKIHFVDYILEQNKFFSHNFHLYIFYINHNLFCDWLKFKSTKYFSTPEFKIAFFVCVFWAACGLFDFVWSLQAAQQCSFLKPPGLELNRITCKDPGADGKSKFLHQLYWIKLSFNSFAQLWLFCIIFSIPQHLHVFFLT